MKKLICFVVILPILLSCLTGCNFTQKMSGALAEAAEATPKVEEMMAALAKNSISNAKSLMHPQVAKTADDAIAQMSAYLAGREAASMQLQNLNVNTSAGTSGKTRQEQVAYKVTLTDGAVIYLNVVYLSNHQGTGFSSFQLVLGVV